MMRFAVGLLAGALLVVIDNFAFHGEASPIVIVLMLLAAAAVLAAIWGRSGLSAIGLLWVCVPMAHVVKHVLGLPDTLHPNTYRSIVYLAVFTLCIAVIGALLGLLARKLTSRVNPARR